MTSRERVLLAINHKKTDRAPADYDASTEVTAKLIQRLGIADHEELLQALQVDMRRISCDYGQPEADPDFDGYLRTMWGGKRRKKDPGDVRAEVRSYLDLTREGGGYILTGNQSFIEDIPLDNILAMYDENQRNI